MPPQPNVLFLLSDEHSYRYFSHRNPDSQGEPVDTPTFDELAETSAVFDQTYCQVPLCTPSRVALLTGQEAQHAGAWDSSSLIEPQQPSIAKRFSEAGYESCLIGKMHQGGNRQFCGFNHRPYGDLGGGMAHQPDRPDLDSGVLGRRSRVRDSGVTMIPESMLQEFNVVRETVGFLREHQHENPEQPWFLCASFSRPHHPLTAPKRHISKYWPDEVPPPKVGHDVDTVNHPHTVGFTEEYKFDEIDHDEMMQARAGYFANVDFLDEIIGDLLHSLRYDGLLENTIIVYTSDHGELGGEHGMWWKPAWQEAATRVPWFIQLPEHRSGDVAPGRLNTPVSLADLFPTLCGLAGLSIPKEVDGTDLSNSVRHGTEPNRGPVFCDFLTPKLGEGTEFRAVRDGKYKYVQFRDAPELLYNLEVDPFEQSNLAPGAEGNDAENLTRLRKLVNETMDFEAAEEQRLKNIRKVEEKYPRDIPWQPLGGSGNMYHLPDGRIVAADSPLYNPDVVTENPSDVFSDWPEQ